MDFYCRAIKYEHLLGSVLSQATRGGHPGGCGPVVVVVGTLSRAPGPLPEVTETFMARHV